MIEEKLRVLLVDDDPDLVDMLREALDDSGRFKVFVAHSGTEAYGRIHNLNLDAMVTDFKMPTMNGAELVSLANTSQKMRKLPILFLSGSTQDIPRQVLQRSLIDVLDKPCDPEKLMQKVMMLIKKRRMQELSQAEIDAHILNAFIGASRETMIGFAGLQQCENGKLFVLDPELQLKACVTASVPMNVEKFHGDLMVSFPEKTLLNILQKMLGDSVTELTEEGAQAAGEFVNVVWARTRTILNTQTFALKNTFPKVTWGQDKKSSAVANAPMMVIPFLTELGEFYVVFSVNVESEKRLM